MIGAKGHNAGVLQVCATDENNRPCVVDLDERIRKVLRDEAAKKPEPKKDASEKPDFLGKMVTKGGPK